MYWEKDIKYMSIRKKPFAVDEYYHLYSRGVEKRSIFLEENDYKHFVSLLFLCNSNKSFVFRSIPKKDVENFSFDCGEVVTAIGAYCLMPNHFHILIRETMENGISKFMNKLLTSYSMYFNKKYKRTGTLFEGVFQASYVDKDEYLKYLFSYIHLNPIKLVQFDWKDVGINNPAKAKNFLMKYKYSSYLSYKIPTRLENKILKKDVFPEYFPTISDFQDSIDTWLNYKEEFSV